MKNEKKSKNKNKYFFTFTFLYRKIYILLENIFGKNLVYITTFVLQFFHVPGYWKCINKTPTPI